VNVGGLIASTLELSDAPISSNRRRFSGSGTGSVVNQGTIQAANGGYVTLLGNQVSNQGIIHLGTLPFFGCHGLLTAMIRVLADRAADV
jgi:hypothetical protein